jgi:putative membrane protein
MHMANFLLYLAVTLGLLLVGLFLMEVTTKVKEFSLMAKGNKAASYVLGGRLLGLAIVLYSTAANSISLADMAIWGAIGIIAQIIVFYLAEWLTPRFNVMQSIEEDNQAVGLFLMFLSVSIGVVIAGCLTY